MFTFPIDNKHQKGLHVYKNCTTDYYGEFPPIGTSYSMKQIVTSFHLSLEM